MTRRERVRGGRVALALAAVMTLAAMGCGSSSPESDAPADPVDRSTERFCDDLADGITVLDQYSRVFREDGSTVAQLRDGATELAAIQADLEDSAAALAASIEAANAAAVAGSASSSTTLLLDAKSAEDHIAAVEQADRELERTAADAEDMTIADATIEVQAAAFGLQQAYVALFVDAGCLADRAAAARAVADYTAALQEDLTAAGFYSGPIDGIYGPATVEAVKALQQSAGLDPTGVVDPATEAALGEAVAAAGEQEALNVAALQGALTVAGTYTGPIDGVWSPEVEEALAAFQTQQELEATGAIDPATLAALMNRSNDDTGESSTTTAGEEPTSTTEAPASSSTTSASTTPTSAP